MALVNATNGAVTAQYEYDPFLRIIRATGPLSKLMPFLGATKYYDWETGWYYYGYRYLRDGWWLSRDPIGEEGGPNPYGFCGGDSIRFLDLLGLKWRVFRTRFDRALAFYDCGDTVRQLAQQIHLDPADYTKWLQGEGPSPIPSSVDEPLAPGAVYTIPNRVYINDLLSLWGPDILLVTAFRQWERVEVRDLKHEGFKVVPVDDTLRDQFLAQMSDPDVHGIVVLAHGDPDRQGDFSDAGPGYVTPEEAVGALHHKLGGFKAVWCFSGVKKSGWRGLVSPTGYLWSHKGYIRIWHSWPGVIRHGFKDE